MIIKDMYLPSTHELSTMTDGDSVLVTVLNVLGDDKPSQQAEITLSRYDIARLAAMYPIIPDEIEPFMVLGKPVQTVPDPAVRQYAKGDRCRMLPGQRVEHYDCDDYPDGHITTIN
jgi:hypothetical protein